MATMIESSNIAAVRFNKVGKLYYFDVGAYPELEPSDHVIVETARGRQLGQIISFVDPDSTEMRRMKPISRPASARDMMMRQLWEAKEIEALVRCRELGVDLTKKFGVKFVKARYNFDGSLLVFLFTSEEPNIDTNRLRRKLGQDFDTRVEVRRIGARDAAKLLGEYGACGAPRCCSTHLTEFSPISIKMAKAQGISLNPSEITGMCGRLRCCLVYEYEQYVEATRHLPRRGKRIGTPHGEGRVIDVNALKDSVTVIVEDRRHEVMREEVIPLAEFKALKEKSAQGCSREGEGGPCECGARVRSGKPPEAQHQPEQQARSQGPTGGQGEQKPESPDDQGDGRRRRRKRRRRGRSRGDQGGGQD